MRKVAMSLALAVGMTLVATLAALADYIGSGP
jgi:hypothetical protein